MGHLEQVVDPAQLRTCWEAKPFLSTRLGDLSDVISGSRLAELTDRRALRLPFVGMILDGNIVDDTEFAHDIGAVTGVIDQQRVLTCLEQGATMVLRGLRMYDARVDDLCRSLQHELGHPVHANSYLTPAHSRGADAHADAHSVIIRQVEGRKHWIVRAPDVADSSTPTEPSEAVLDVDLEPGQSLYVPRGFIHEGWTDADPSLHLTLNFGQPHRWVDAFIDVLSQKITPVHALEAIAPPRDSDNLRDRAGQALTELHRILDEVSSAQLIEAMQQHLGEAIEPQASSAVDLMTSLWTDSEAI